MIEVAKDLKNALQIVGGVLASIVWLAIVGIGVVWIQEDPPLLGRALLMFALALGISWLTIDRWMPMLPGVLALGAVNAAVASSSGQLGFGTDAAKIDRGEAAAVAILFVLSAAITARFSNRQLPSFERLAIMFCIGFFVLSWVAPNFPIATSSAMCASLLVGWRGRTIWAKLQHD